MIDSKNPVAKGNGDFKILINESQSLTPTYWVLAISFVLCFTIAIYSGNPLGLYGKLLVIAVASIASLIYVRRSFYTDYILTDIAVGVVSMSFLNPNDKSVNSIDIHDIHYVYSRQTGIRWLLAKLHIINYGDLCFCESVSSPPTLVFHNVSNINKKLTSAESIIG